MMGTGGQYLARSSTDQIQLALELGKCLDDSLEDHSHRPGCEEQPEGWGQDLDGTQAGLGKWLQQKMLDLNTFYKNSGIGTLINVGVVKENNGMETHDCDDKDGEGSDADVGLR